VCGAQAEAKKTLAEAESQLGDANHLRETERAQSQAKLAECEQQLQRMQAELSESRDAAAAPPPARSTSREEERGRLESRVAKAEKRAIDTMQRFLAAQTGSAGLRAEVATLKQQIHRSSPSSPVRWHTPQRLLY
jgi:phytoene dehydrogenase-like protein